MNKLMTAILLLSFSCLASAEYRVTVHDFAGDEAYTFESCTMMFSSFEPGKKDSSYIYVTCNARPVTDVLPFFPEGLPTSALEEVGINYFPNVSIERGDCRLVRFFYEGISDPGYIVVECGVPQANNSGMFRSGFESAA